MSLPPAGPRRRAAVLSRLDQHVEWKPFSRIFRVFGFDYKHKPEAWHHSLQHGVLPRLNHLDTTLGKAAQHARDV